ncbi:MAG: hypothetical protein WKF84_22045 [Pyrinomonadaceae bacterium]
MTEQDIQDSAARGAVEAPRSRRDVRVGDASDIGHASISALNATGLRGIVFQEVFGPDAMLAKEQLAKLQAKVEVLRTQETHRARVGVSPHAPYTGERIAVS